MTISEINKNMAFTIVDCSLGYILIAQSNTGICAILIGDDREVLATDLRQRFHDCNCVEERIKLKEISNQIIDFIDYRILHLDLPLDLRGTKFQQLVWHNLRAIPKCTTTTYAKIAAQIGQPKAFRAVATACAANHLAVIIPCHRVLRSDGNISGYRWGVNRKIELLKREGVSPQILNSQSAKSSS